VEPLYRSRLATVCRLWWQWLEPVLCFEDAEEIVGVVDARRTDQA
jgi:hypothetical protein